jgi:Cu/Zn superoxide dismutase
VKLTQIRRYGLSATGALLPLILLGCSDDAEIASTDVTAPPAARIGNVATADLESLGTSAVSGSATFAQLEEALSVEISASGLSAGEYTVALQGDEACAGAEARDFGNLGRLTADADGMGHMTRELPERTLIGDPGVVSRSIVLYPGETSGQPVACGVIEWGTSSLANNQ